MSFLVLLGIAVGLSMDAFAVAIAASVAIPEVNGRQVFRFSFHFGLFQALMPAIGWMAGQTIGQWVRVWDHWVAFILLLAIGLKALHEAFKKAEDDPDAIPKDPTKGWSLVTFSVATSIDALAVGVSFAMLGVNVLYPCLLIGLVTGSLTMMGMLVGSRLGMRFGKTMEVIGGLVLIGIGTKILLTDMLG